MFGKGFGTSVNKLFRKEANDNSVDAAFSVDTKSMEQLVYETIGKFPDGCIQDEVLQVLSFMPYSSVTARFKALKDKGYIEVIGSRPGRSGRNQSVMRCKHDRLA